MKKNRLLHAAAFGSASTKAEDLKLEVNDAGSPVRRLGRTQDVTEGTLAEKALEGAHDELERRVLERTAELERTNAALQAEIVERKRTESALRESEYHTRQLVNVLPAAVYACDTQGYITFYNQAAVALWGRKPELAKDLWCGSWRLCHPDGSPLRLEECPMAVALREGRPVRGREIIIERPDGTRTCVLPYPDPVRDASGAVVGTVNMLVDLTERRRVEVELQRANGRITEIFESISDAFVALDREWRYTYVNKRAAHLLGKPKDHLIGQCVWDLFPETVGTEADRKCRQALATQDSVVFEAFNPVFGQWYENHVYPTREGISIYWRDITERKRVEEARQARARRLAAIIRTQQEIASTALDLSAVMHSIVERAQSLTGAMGATLELIEQDELVYHITSGAAAPHAGLRVNAASSLSGLCVRSGEILLCDDAATDGRVDAEACRRVGLRSMIVVPLRHGDANLGVLKVFSSQPRSFADEDVNTLRLLAGFLATAMHLAAEFEAKQALVAERTTMLESLRQSESLLRLFVQHTPAAVAMFDREQRYILASCRWRTDLRLGEQELIGRSHSEVFPDMPNRWEAVHQRCLAGAVERCEEDTFPAADGTMDWARWEMHPWTYAGGEIGGTIIFAEIITARKRAEEALRESDERFAAFMRNMPAGASIQDLEGRYVYLNEYLMELFGGRSGECGYLEKPDREPWPGAVADQLEASNREILRTGKPIQLEERIDAEDGTHHFLVHKFPILAKDGNPRLLGRVGVDITVRKRMEEALQESETRLRSALQRREIYARQQATIAEFGRRALTCENLSSLLEDVVGAVARTLDLDICNALEFLPNGQAFLVRAGAGPKAGLVAGITLPASTGSPSGDALRNNKLVVFDHRPKEARAEVLSSSLEDGVVSGAVVLIPGRTGPFGVLQAYSTRHRLFTEDDTHFLQAVTAIVGTAIERHELEKELLEISGREQRRIGHDLHDDLCQRLGGLQLLSGVLEEELAAAGRPQAAQAGRILTQVREALERARLLARGLAPVALEEDGLATALQELADNSARLYGISCEFRAPAPVALADPGAATHLYRIAQEAISNAVKHGHAKQVVISLTERKDTFQLAISDDGRGFVSTTAAPCGMGLRIMQYRAAMIGATQEIRSADREGTTVICTFGKQRRGGERVNV